MELTLIKTQTYKLEPYGHFVFKWNRPKNEKPHQIPVAELRMYHDSAMPMTKEQEDVFVKEMKKFKTDVFTDGERFYTRTSSGMTEIYHVKLYNYKTDPMYRELVDANERFS